MSKSASRFPPLRERVFQGSKVAYFGTSTNLESGRPPKYKEWTEERMAMAMRSVHEGKSIRRAAMECGIPKSTLGDRISGRVLPGMKSGPHSYLTAEEEEELATFITRCAAIGYGKTRKDVLALVQRICASRGLCVTISGGWWDSFVRRHPNLTLRAPAPLSHARSNASSYDIVASYFDLLEETLVENDLLSKPGQLYNMDESGMPLDPKPPKIVHVRGVKNPLSNCSNTKAQITIVGCVSAADQVLPPMVVWDRKTLTPKLAEGEVPGTIYGLSPKGWMDQELFDLWFTRHFLRFIPPVRPVLLIMDGHSSHYCPDTIRLAAEEQIIVFALPPNTTHLTQPLDKGVFGPLKVCWREVCHSFLVKNPGKVITRYDFSALFSEAWFKAMRPENAIAGFKVTGICPFDRGAIRIPGSVEEGKALAAKSDLAFIPLYTPSKRRHASLSSYSAMEMEHFQCSYELGLNPGSRYRDWLKFHHPEDVQGSSTSSDSVLSTPLSLTSPPSPSPYLAATLQPALRKFVSVPCLLEKISKFQPPEKSSARVLTSSECLQKLLEKEEEKLAKQRKKDKNKRKREENRKKREENKRITITRKKRPAKAQKGTDSSLFTEEEVALFTTRYENGYDIPQKRYVQWLQTHDPSEAQRLLKLSTDALSLADGVDDNSISDVDSISGSIKNKKTCAKAVHSGDQQEGDRSDLLISGSTKSSAMTDQSEGLQDSHNLATRVSTKSTKSRARTTHSQTGQSGDQQEGDLASSGGSKTCSTKTYARAGQTGGQQEAGGSATSGSSKTCSAKTRARAGQKGGQQETGGSDLATSGSKMWVTRAKSRQSGDQTETGGPDSATSGSSKTCSAKIRARAGQKGGQQEAGGSVI